MKLNKLSAAVSLVLVASVGVIGCHDSKDRRTTYSETTAIDGYLQNAVCCVDVTGNSSCDDEASTTRTDINGVCRVDSSLVGDLLVIGDEQTTDSNEQGVTGDPVEPGFVLVAPAGSATISPFTTLVQLQARLFNTSFAEASAALATMLGLDPSIDFTTYDHVAAAAQGDTTAVQVAVIAQIVTQAIAANMNALAQTGAAGGDTRLQLATAVNLLINADNAAGVKGPGTLSLFEAIVAVVQEAADPTTVTYQSGVVNNPDITAVDNIPSNQLGSSLQDAVNQTNEQIVTPPPPPPPGTGGTGGAGGVT